MNMKYTLRFAVVPLALLLSTAYATDTTKPAAAETSTTTQASQPMTGKQKATAIGATSGAVAGAVVAGPVGAVVGAGIGGYVGHQGTDANGKVPPSNTKEGSVRSDGTVRSAQEALRDKGYSVGAVDGQWGPNTQSAVRRFQAERGLAQTGTLDSATLSALGVNG